MNLLDHGLLKASVDKFVNIILNSKKSVIAVLITYVSEF
jgi:hypothetical protein